MNGQYLIHSGIVLTTVAIGAMHGLWDGAFWLGFCMLGYGLALVLWKVINSD